MIALVLAAGFGSRLRPYSDHTPKPLFTLNRQPLLDIMIRRLIAAGAHTVIVNTHHRHQRIEDFLHRQSYAATIVTRHESTILGTGGAIRNTADIWQAEPLLVVNSDIVTDVDFRAFYHFHRAHGQPASLTLCDHPAFNSVFVDSADTVVAFGESPAGTMPHEARRLTFTGVQVLNDAILAYLPPEGFASSIDAFQAMIADGHRLPAYIPEPLQWSDLGTPERYQAMARSIMAQEALRQAGETEHPAAIEWQPLPGDGSDRQWYRLRSGKTRMIVADHGIKPSEGTCEAEAFVAIGQHLHRKGLPVPQIYLEDPFAGLVFMEDLGSENYQARVRKTTRSSAIEEDYRRVIDTLLAMAFDGGEDFDPHWTYQTRRYDRAVVLQNECRYFVRAFLNDYLGMETDGEVLASEFNRLADAIMTARPVGFMHRDFQSRNIMVMKDRFYLIDFQGGRIGPPHYDLASLLIDPYVDLPFAMRETLLVYFSEQLAQRSPGIPAAEIQKTYRYCALARNLQILGAYGFLTRRKGKPHFSHYIPAAVRSLQQTLSHFDRRAFPILSILAKDAIPEALSANDTGRAAAVDGGA
jgi:aminoglycoside/choline kinase family phosphotransferase/GTP:adenosylcobinamide-phosphate guanylyltransferase